MHVSVIYQPLQRSRPCVRIEKFRYSKKKKRKKNWSTVVNNSPVKQMRSGHTNNSQRREVINSFSYTLQEVQRINWERYIWVLLQPFSHSLLCAFLSLKEPLSKPLKQFGFIESPWEWMFYELWAAGESLSSSVSLVSFSFSPILYIYFTITPPYRGCFRRLNV